MENYSKPSNPNAFPRTAFDSKGDITTWDGEFQGMTLRDYFAAKAIGGMLSNSTLQVTVGMTEEGIVRNEHVSVIAYAIADAMLKVRES